MSGGARGPGVCAEHPLSGGARGPPPSGGAVGRPRLVGPVGRPASRGAHGPGVCAGWPRVLRPVSWSVCGPAPWPGGACEPAPCLVEPAGLEHVRGLARVWWSRGPEACVQAGPCPGGAREPERVCGPPLSGGARGAPRLVEPWAAPRLVGPVEPPRAWGLGRRVCARGRPVSGGARGPEGVCARLAVSGVEPVSRRSVCAGRPLSGGGWAAPSGPWAPASRGTRGPRSVCAPWAALCLVEPVDRPRFVEPVGRPVSRGARGPELRGLCLDYHHGLCPGVWSTFWPTGNLF